MNPTGKKLISLFLIFTFMMLSANLYAKERRGAKLIIKKKDGQQVEGELITVKPNSLLLLNSEGKDVSVDIADIKVIRIVKKSKVGTGVGIGLIPGVVLSGIAALAIEDWDSLEALGLLITAGIAVVGAIIGAIIGAAAGTDKTIQIEGMTDSEIRETLDKLRKKARLRDYK